MTEGIARRAPPPRRHRLDALFTIGQIYKDDLGDDTRAKEIFQEYLKKYPHSRSADDARDAIAQLNKGAAKEWAKNAAAKKSTANSATNAGRTFRSRSALRISR